MKTSILVLCLALSGCAGFNFRPFALVVCTSQCDFVLHGSKAASAP